MTISVCLFGHCDPNYSRQWIFKNGLESSNIEVYDCIIFPKELEILRKEKGNIAYTIEVIRLLRKKFYLGGQKCDVLLLCANNHTIALYAKYLALRHKMKLVFDSFDSVYYGVRQRNKHYKNRVFYPFVYLTEFLALHLADKVIILNKFYGDYFRKTFFVKKQKMNILLEGASLDRLDKYLIDTREQNSTDKLTFDVLYWGNFLVHHGLHVIVEAAKLLNDNDKIHFHFVGKGLLTQEVQDLADKMNLTNVTFYGRVTDIQLAELMSNADVCLGIFSSDPKALISITNKVFEGMALGKPVITEKSIATQEYLKDKENILLVPPENAVSLVNAILELFNDRLLAQTLGRNAKSSYDLSFSTPVLGRELKTILLRITKTTK